MKSPRRLPSLVLVLATVLTSAGPARASTLGDALGRWWDDDGSTLILIAAVAGWLGVIILMPFARIRWRRQQMEPPLSAAPEPSPVATAEAEPAAVSPPPPPEKAVAFPPGSFRMSLSDPVVGYAVSIDLIDLKITVGRARDNMVVVPRASVASYQAVLNRNDDGSYRLTNLATTGPTLVNGAEVQSHQLKPGDRLGMGTVEGLFEAADPANSAPA